VIFSGPKCEMTSVVKLIWKESRSQEAANLHTTGEQFCYVLSCLLSIFLIIKLFHVHSSIASVQKRFLVPTKTAPLKCYVLFIKLHKCGAIEVMGILEESVSSVEMLELVVD